MPHILILLAILGECRVALDRTAGRCRSHPGPREWLASVLRGRHGDDEASSVRSQRRWGPRGTAADCGGWRAKRNWATTKWDLATIYLGYLRERTTMVLACLLLLLLLLVNRRSSCRFRLLRATAALVEVVPLIVRVVVSACRLVV